MKRATLFQSLLAGALSVVITACDPKPGPPESIPPPPTPAAPDAPEPVASAEPSKPREIIHHALFDGSNDVTQTGMKQYLADEPIPVDFGAIYHLSATAESSGPDSAKERQYLGFACYDADGHGIATYQVAKYPGSADTTLAADLTPGDTRIDLADATGWNNLGTEHRCAIAWYGYTDQAGHTYPDYTYTRNFVADLWDAGAVSGNTITLLKAWPGPALKAGTAVRNAESGGSYNYALNGGTAIPGSATPFEATVSGIWTNGIYSDTVFRPGTAFIRPLILANWNGTESTLSVSDFEIKVVPTP